LNLRVLTDVSAKAGPARDQGKRPTCVAFALSDLHASVRTTVFIPLSVEYLFYHASRLAYPFNPRNGVTLQQALRALDQDGQPAEKAWPYLPQLPVDLTQYRPPQINGAIHRKNGNRIRGKVVDKLEEEMKAGRPAVFVFRSTLRLMLAKAGQPVTWSVADQILLPHAVVAVSIGRTKSERFVRVKNSWGSGWADSGYAWLSEEYVDKTFIELVGMV